MDEKFLEFWGNILINAARSKKQTDDFFRWMKSAGQGKEAPRAFPGTEELSELFRKFYGLDQVSERGEEYKQLYEKSLRYFQKSFKDSMGLMGIVPREEHLALVRKYEKLKERCAEQEETIRHLRMLLTARENGQTDISGQLQEVMRSQSELFQRMVSEFGQCFTRPGDTAGDESTPRGKGDTHDDETDDDGSKPTE